MQCGGSRPIPISAGPFDDDDGRHKVMSTGYAVRLAGASSHPAGADFGLRTFERRSSSALGTNVKPMDLILVRYLRPRSR